MKKIIVFALGALCLTGCGKRGRLDFPPDTTYPRQYPAVRQPKMKTVAVPETAPFRNEEEFVIKTEEKQ